MGAVPDLEHEFITRLADEDHLVRAEAARALGHCQTGTVVDALREARADRSLVVREAAEESLERLMLNPPLPSLPPLAIAPIPPLPVVASPEASR